MHILPREIMKLFHREIPQLAETEAITAITDFGTIMDCPLFVGIDSSFRLRVLSLPDRALPLEKTRRRPGLLYLWSWMWETVDAGCWMLDVRCEMWDGG